MSNHKIAGLLIPMATSKKVIREFARFIKNYLTNLTFKDYKILKTSYLAVLDDLHSEKKEGIIEVQWLKEKIRKLKRY